MKKILAVLLCVFLLAGCRAVSAETDINGQWLGRDIDECYAAWKIVPGENALKIGGDSQERILLTNPVNYLGEKFFVLISYPAAQDSSNHENKFYYNKLDRLVYFLDFYKTADESVAEKTAEVFTVLQDEYGALTQIFVTQNTYNVDGTILNSSYNSANSDILQKDGIVQEMKKASEAGKTLSIHCEWSLPEEYEKLDSGFVEAMEKHNGFQSTYCLQAALEYLDGRYIFSVTHTFGRQKITE